MDGLAWQRKAASVPTIDLVECIERSGSLLPSCSQAVRSDLLRPKASSDIGLACEEPVEKKNPREEKRGGLAVDGSSLEISTVEVGSIFTSDSVRSAAEQALKHFGNSVDEPIQLVDLGNVQSQIQLWKKHLPNVRPHYAVKCCPNKQIIKQLRDGGCGFDCATMQEISTVLELGVTPADIVYSHPCKPRSHIAFAKSQGICLMSFDNDVELRKVAAVYPEAQLLLRVVCEDSSAQCPMSLKFGAKRDTWATLLDIIQELQLNLAGVSFHVGSGCKDPETFEPALADAREVFRMASERGMKALRVLDIGGGYPGDRAGYEEIAPVIAEKLGRLFPESEFPELTRIAEPGRFFAANSGHLLTKVYAKAKLPATDGSGEQVCRYYLNDGLYGSFNCIIYDHVEVRPEPIRRVDGDEVPCALFGPTCDGFDVVLEKHRMPELEEGDWILWRNMGAYTSAAGCNFNGFPLALSWYYRAPPCL
ncbi:ODC1 [Symbiodinium sp. CCMP2592]|nr:ODC1 [Symbiodinium sp. CCMP2592]